MSPFMISLIDRFLLAKLHLDSMLDGSTPNKRKKALASLPQILNGAYEIEMMRIKRNAKYYEVAKGALSWVYFAKRPLHMMELCEALAVQSIEDNQDADGDGIDLDPGNLEKPDFILDSCRSLILWDRTIDVIRFSHYMVSDFFKENAAENIESELYIAQTCLTYLGFKEFEILCDGDSSLHTPRMKYKFAKYAGYFWGAHMKDKNVQNDHSIQHLALNDFGVGARRQASYQITKQLVLCITASHDLLCSSVEPIQNGNQVYHIRGIINKKIQPTIHRRKGMGSKWANCLTSGGSRRIFGNCQAAAGSQC